MGELTTTPLDVVIVVTLGYVLGSVPVANLVARRHDRGLDLRTVGDRNPGYWNAKETLGRSAAATVFVGDVAKGAAAGTAGWLLADPGVWGVAYAAVGAAMVGHAFPAFDGLRGGRSVLAFVGGALVLSPLSAAVAIAVLVAVLAATRSFANAARVGIVTYPLAQLVVDGPNRTAATGLLMTFIGLRFAQAAVADRRRAVAQS